MSNIRYNLFDIESICESLTSQASDDKCTIEKLKNDMNSLVNDSILNNPTYAYLSARDYTDTVMMPLVSEYDNACTSLIDTAKNIRIKYSELCFNEDLDLDKLEMEKSQNISTFDNINNYLDYLCQRNPGLNNKIIDYRDEYKSTHEKSINKIQLKIDNLQEFDRYCSTILTPVVDNYQQLKDTVDEKPLYDSSEEDNTPFIEFEKLTIDDFFSNWDDILDNVLKRLSKSAGRWISRLGKYLGSLGRGVGSFLSGIAKGIGIVGNIITFFENLYIENNDVGRALIGLTVDILVDYFVFSCILSNPGIVAFIVGGVIINIFLNSKVNGKSLKERLVSGIDFGINWVGELLGFDRDEYK